MTRTAPTRTEPTPLIDTFRREHGFVFIGSYELASDDSVFVETPVKITERRPLVYVIFADDICRYVGKSVQGYIRPLTYHKNGVMTDVRDGILSDLKAGRKVTVYAKTAGLDATHEGLDLNLIEAIEQSLIREYRPTWNNQVQSFALQPAQSARLKGASGGNA